MKHHLVGVDCFGASPRFSYAPRTLARNQGPLLDWIGGSGMTSLSVAGVGAWDGKNEKIRREHTHATNERINSSLVEVGESGLDTMRGRQALRSILCFMRAW